MGMIKQPVVIVELSPGVTWDSPQGRCCHLMVVATSVKLGRDVGQSLPLVGGDAGVPQGLHAQPPGGVDPGSGISVSTS